MRLPPVEHPPTLLGKLAYFMTRKRLGKVIAPLSVVYARIPRSMRMAYQISNLIERGLTLEPELRLLIQSLVAGINGCRFCTDIAKALAIRGKIGLEKIDALGQYKTSEVFDEREKAALAYAEEATRNKRVSQDTFEQLKSYFSDREIAEITLLNAIENYFNLINLPLEIESDGLCALASPTHNAP